MVPMCIIKQRQQNVSTLLVSVEHLAQSQGERPPHSVLNHPQYQFLFCMLYIFLNTFSGRFCPISFRRIFFLLNFVS